MELSVQSDRVGRSRPTESGFELYAWLFMRVSGVVLLLMALIHLAIMHLINDIEQINYAFVAARYATPFWRIYDLVLLVLALVHGLNGIRTLIEDFVNPAGWRLLSLSVLYTIGFVFLVIGTFVVVTFQPVSP